jgi:predicted regulator of Ras-like GTPase activity (Roadblock/LC7/MglB family)
MIAGAGATRTEMTAALATLTDVAGITGSFVFTSSGLLVAREIQAMFDDTALAEAAERLARLRDTFGAVGDQLEIAVIRFQDYKLYLKVLAGGTLCILTTEAVNMAALRMAANLVGRRITPELERMDAATNTLSAGGPMASSAPPPQPESAPSFPPRSPVIAPGTRRFRGRAVE